MEYSLLTEKYIKSPQLALFNRIHWRSNRTIKSIGKFGHVRQRNIDSKIAQTVHVLQVHLMGLSSSAITPQLK
jgi:hypothetical protein